MILFVAHYLVTFLKRAAIHKINDDVWQQIQMLLVGCKYIIHNKNNITVSKIRN